MNKDDTDFLAWTRRELDSHHFCGPQAVLEGQTKLQGNLRKLDFHRHTEQAKDKDCKVDLNQKCCLKAVQLCRRTHLIVRLHWHRGYSDMTGINKDCIFAVWTKGNFHTHSILSPGLKPSSERPDSLEGNRRAVEIRRGFERLEGQSCLEAAGKYSEKQVQRAETWVCHGCLQVKQTAWLLNFLLMIATV